MITIDKLNMILTGISIIATGISIIYSCKASKSVKLARQYKEETLHLREVLDLENLSSKFLAESKYFLDKTRSKDWYRGIDVNYIISPFKEVLSSFGKLYHLVNVEDDLKYKVHTLNDMIQTYDRATASQKTTVNSLILEIGEILQQEIHNNTNLIIKK